MVEKSWGIHIDYKIAVTTWLGTLWLILSMFVRMGNNSTNIPVYQVFTGGLTNDTYQLLNLALLLEWIIYTLVALVEFIAWIIALTGDPMFYVIWAYVSLWLSIFLYGIPVCFLIAHGYSTGIGKTINWTTDGALAHLIVDGFLWAITGFFHFFFYPDLLSQF